MVLKKISNFVKLWRNECPKMAIWAILNYCNTSCMGCQFQKAKQKRRVSLEDAKKTISFFQKNNIGLVALTGGEPLMHPHIWGIIEELNKKNIVIAYLTTNNTLLNEENAKRIGKLNINIVGVSVKLDYFLMKDSEAKRKETERIKKATYNLKKYKVNFYGGVILSKHTKDIHSLCNTMKSLGFEKVSFSYPQTEQHSSWKAFNNSDYLNLSKEEAEKITKEILEIKKKKIIPIYNTEESLKEFLRYYSGEPPKYPCYCGNKMFYIDWDNNIYKCFTLSHKLGNILDGTELKTNLPHKEKCLQHAFKDPSIFYSGLDEFYKIKEFLLKGKIKSCINCIKDKKSKDSLKSLLEIATSPFI